MANVQYTNGTDTVTFNRDIVPGTSLLSEYVIEHNGRHAVDGGSAPDFLAADYDGPPVRQA